MDHCLYGFNPSVLPRVIIVDGQPYNMYVCMFLGVMKGKEKACLLCTSNTGKILSTGGPQVATIHSATSFNAAE